MLQKTREMYWFGRNGKTIQSRKIYKGKFFF